MAAARCRQDFKIRHTIHFCIAGQEWCTLEDDFVALIRFCYVTPHLQRSFSATNVYVVNTGLRQEIGKPDESPVETCLCEYVYRL